MIFKRVALEKFDIRTAFSPMEEMGFFIDNELVPFDNNATKFSISNAWWLADHSRLAYTKNQKTATKILNDAGYTNVKFIWNHESGAKVYVAWNDEYAVVSFTGTEADCGPVDILADLNFFPKSSGQGGFVHRGFKNSFDSIWGDLKTILDKIDGRYIWLTGHSMGGALAIHAASRIIAKGCYTFGSPRMSSGAFNKTVLTPTYRIVKNNDIITRVPTPPIYCHCGDNYFITDDQKILVNPGALRMFKERLGGSELMIFWLLLKVLVFKSSIDFILGYLLGHNPYNYSVFMWNNILDK